MRLAPRVRVPAWAAPEPRVRRFVGWLPAGRARITVEGPFLPEVEREVDLAPSGAEPFVVDFSR